MRSALLSALLAAALLAGCASPTPPADGTAPADGAEVSTETRELPFSQPAAFGAGGAAPGVFGREAFTVPDGTLRMTVEASWRCVTMCPLEIRLVDPAGEVAATGAGGFDATIPVEAPAAGSWTFDFYARDGATAGTEGVARITFESLA